MTVCGIYDNLEDRRRDLVKQLTEIIYSIEVPLPGNPLRNLNSYLILGESRNLMIDTGFNMNECLEALQSGLDEIGVTMENTDIMLTHLHADHCGLAPSLVSDQSRVYMNSTDLELFHQFSKPEFIRMRNNRYSSFGFSEEQLIRNKMVNPSIIYLSKKKIKYIPIEDGHVFDMGTCRLRCIMTPGHTPGHTCLYDEENGILFSGDHVLFGISPNITSWPGVEDSLGDYLSSLGMVGELEIKRTFSAHRAIEGDAKARITVLVEHHQMRLDEAESIIRRLGEATVYDIASEMTWAIRAKNWGDFPLAQKWFAVGETHSHLEYLLIRNRINLIKRDGLLSYSSI